MALATAQGVLVAVDGGPHSWDALVWAAADAAATRQRLRIVHVVRWGAIDVLTPWPAGEEAARACAAGELLLRDAARRAREVAPDLELVTWLEGGAGPSPALLRAGADANVIVLGRRRDGRVFGGRFSRSVIRYIVRRARCPVVIVKLSARAAGPATGRVAVVVDSNNDQTTPALTYASAAAARRGCAITALDAGCQDAASTLAVASAGAALLVLTARPRSHTHGAVVPPAMRSLADSATAPVVIVKNADPTGNWEHR
jgi:nucleotide-binding universal stress UspA family protein